MGICTASPVEAGRVCDPKGILKMPFVERTNSPCFLKGFLSGLVSKSRLLRHQVSETTGFMGSNYNGYIDIVGAEFDKRITSGGTTEHNNSFKMATGNLLQHLVLFTEMKSNGIQDSLSKRYWGQDVPRQTRRLICCTQIQILQSQREDTIKISLK